MGTKQSSLMCTTEIPEIDKRRLDWYRRRLGRGIGKRGELKALAAEFPSSLGGPLDWAPASIVKNRKAQLGRGLYSLVFHLPGGEQTGREELSKYLATRQKAAPARIVRRSIVLPGDLVKEISQIAPPELRDNFNRLVTTALREYIEIHRTKAFERAMQEMAADPQIQSACNAINREFAQFESDGLGD